ncbi:MAG: sulfotransferase [Gammaproteobacteria bacterium]|jgi:hypothetical protein
MKYETAKKMLSWKVQLAIHCCRRKFRVGKGSPPEEMRLIFGIGMHRTGTRSLSEYLNNLGLRALHWPWWCERDIGKCLERDNDADVLQLLEPLFYQYDCFLDVPFSGLFRELDSRFPLGRFILTTRDSDGWWNSVVRHWKLDDLQSRPLDPAEFIQYRLYPPRDKTIVSVRDKAIQVAKFERHNLEVQRYFGKTDKLLVIDLADTDKNAKVSDFLGMPIRPYPHLGAGEGRHG